MSTNRYLQTVQLDIFCNTDFLGALKEDNCIGAAKFTMCMKQLKARNSTGSVVLDAGDAFMGTPLSNFYYGKPVIEMMNENEYDAMAIGNHEFDWGTDRLLKTLNTANFNVLSANLFYNHGEKVEWAKPYVIVKKKGVSIGIIGLSTVETPYTTASSNVKEYVFRQPIKVVKELIPKVKEDGADIIILLGHLPVYFNGGKPAGELIDLVDSTEDIDVAIGGHSFIPYATLRNDIPIVLTSPRGSMIGHIRICFNRKANQIINKEVKLIDLNRRFNNLNPDQKIQNMVQQYDKGLNKKFSKVIGRTDKDLFVKPDQQFELGSWISNTICKNTSAQIGFYNPYGIFGDIYSGDITVGDIYRICPFNSFLVCSKLTGRQILEILSQSVTLEKGMLQISGLRVKLSSFTEKEYTIKDKDVRLLDGKPLKLDESYTVGTTEFLASGGDKFKTFTEVSWKKTQIKLRAALTDRIKKEGTIKSKLFY